MYEQILTEAGLSFTEATVYEILLKDGEQKASQINRKTPIKRSTVYDALDSLIEKGLVLKNEPEKQVAKFKAADPSALGHFIDQKESTVRRQKNVVDSLLPQLVSDFALAKDKPRVQYYEGLDGQQILIDDTLKTKAVIYSITDVEAVVKNIKRMNDNYVKRREKLGIEKKILVIKSEFNKKFFDELGSDITDVRYLDFDFQMMGTVLSIYDQKISYASVKKGAMLGIIIDHPAIAGMQRSIFENMWQNALPTAD
ncbi:TrmB family transcriptional regulator [Patescibacteria group bacterium]